MQDLKVSPVIGFLATGVVLQQLGLINDREDMETLSELGVLFLLFEMGLELSLDRLKALAKYAFGMGSLQARRAAARACGAQGARRTACGGRGRRAARGPAPRPSAQLFGPLRPPTPLPPTAPPAPRPRS